MAESSANNKLINCSDAIDIDSGIEVAIAIAIAIGCETGHSAGKSILKMNYVCCSAIYTI